MYKDIPNLLEAFAKTYRNQLSSVLARHGKPRRQTADGLCTVLHYRGDEGRGKFVVEIEPDWPRSAIRTVALRQLPGKELELVYRHETKVASNDPE